LYHLRDIASCWSKNPKFYTPPAFSAPAAGDPVGISRSYLIYKTRMIEETMMIC